MSKLPDGNLVIHFNIISKLRKKKKVTFEDDMKNMKIEMNHILMTHKNSKQRI